MYRVSAWLRRTSRRSAGGWDASPMFGGTSCYVNSLSSSASAAAAAAAHDAAQYSWKANPALRGMVSSATRARRYGGVTGATTASATTRAANDMADDDDVDDDDDDDGNDNVRSGDRAHGESAHGVRQSSLLQQMLYEQTQRSQQQRRGDSDHNNNGDGNGDDAQQRERLSWRLQRAFLTMALSGNKIAGRRSGSGGGSGGSGGGVDLAQPSWSVPPQSQQPLQRPRSSSSLSSAAAFTSAAARDRKYANRALLPTTPVSGDTDVLQCIAKLQSPSGKVCDAAVLQGRLIGLLFFNNTPRSSTFLRRLQRFAQRHSPDFVVVAVSMDLHEMADVSVACGFLHCLRGDGGARLQHAVAMYNATLIPLPRLIVVDVAADVIVTRSGVTAVSACPDTCFAAWRRGESGCTWRDRLHFLLM